MNLFHFKEFSLQQELSAMKIGTDGVLLGARANFNSPKRILDIGCGTGLIGLMLAQKYPEAEIMMIDIDENAVNESNINSINSPYAKRISVVQKDFLDWITDLKFDLIVCNPPFHEEDMVSKNEARTVARRAASLPTRDLLNHVSQHLSEGGKYLMILPNALHTAVENSIDTLHCCRELRIKPKASKEVNRILSEWSLVPSEKETDLFILRNETGDYTESYKQLTALFHPQF